MANEAHRGPFDAVLVISFGGPRQLADIRPFLANVLRGRRVPPDRVEEVAHHYELFGGISPLTELTLKQAAGLQARLEAAGEPLPVHVGMRNWHPFLADTLETMSRAGVRRAVGFITAAHRSYSSCTQYKENVREARAELVRRGHPDIDIVYVEDWHHHPGFISAVAEHVKEALGGLEPPLAKAARIVFTAHSIPRSMADTCVYERQLEESCRLVARALGRDDYALVYQSRSGRPQDPWLEPDICDYLRREQAVGLKAAVICPIGFLCDHVEVLYDLDHEAADVCRQIDLPMVRAESVNDDPYFLDMMADVVTWTVDRYKHGRPLPIVSASVPGR